MTTFEGQLNAKDYKFAIVCSRFNDFFVSKLLDGAIDTIVRHGGSEDNIDIAWVPGAFEIPLTTKVFAASEKYDAIIALGLVIDGSTSHATYVNSEVSKGIAQVSITYTTPIVYGVVTTENIEQAIERSGCKAGNRGASAAMTAIEMASLLPQLPKKK